MFQWIKRKNRRTVKRSKKNKKKKQENSEEEQKEEQKKYKSLSEKIKKKFEEGDEKVREEIKKRVEKAKEEMEKSGKDVVSWTDPESRFMKNKKGRIEYYNVQITVESNAGIIVANDVTQDYTDVNQLQPQIEQTEENVGKLLEGTNVSADMDILVEKTWNSWNLKNWRDTSQIRWLLRR